MLAREHGEGELGVPGSLQSPHTHCTLPTGKLPFRLPEQASRLPKTRHIFLIIRKQLSSPIVSLSPCPRQRSVYPVTDVLAIVAADVAHGHFLP